MSSIGPTDVRIIRLKLRGSVKRVFAAAVGALPTIRQMVGAKAMLADLAVDHHVVKRVDVAGGLPHQRMHDDRRVERDDVVAQLDRVAPPRVLDVAFENRAERTVVPKPVDAAVDLARLKDSQPMPAQSDLGLC